MKDKNILILLVILLSLITLSFFLSISFFMVDYAQQLNNKCESICTSKGLDFYSLDVGNCICNNDLGNKMYFKSK